MRLDRWLADRLPELSRARLQALIGAGRVRVDGAVRKAAARLAGGERVEVEIPPPAPEELAPEPAALSIVFEDAHVLVVDKPPGVVVHPGAGHPRRRGGDRPADRPSPARSREDGGAPGGPGPPRGHAVPGARAPARLHAPRGQPRDGPDTSDPSAPGLPRPPGRRRRRLRRPASRTAPDPARGPGPPRGAPGVRPPGDGTPARVHVTGAGSHRAAPVSPPRLTNVGGSDAAPPDRPPPVTHRARARNPIAPAKPAPERHTNGAPGGRIRDNREETNGPLTAGVL